MSQTIWLLVTAHPDDESMFFIPTLRNIILDCQNQNLNQQDKRDGSIDVANNKNNNNNNTNNADFHPSNNNNNIQILCLSNGDYRDVSDGPIRTKEMHDACSIIGIIPRRRRRKTSGNDDDNVATANSSSSSSSSSVATSVLAAGGAATSTTAGGVTVLDDNRMKDGPNEVWNSTLISETVLEYIRTRVVPSVFCADNDDVDNTNDKTKQLKQLQHDYLLVDSDEETHSWSFVEKTSTSTSTTTSATSHSHNSPKSTEQSKQQLPSINLNILTFDEGGVSKHPNHLDTFRGIHHLLNDKCQIITTMCDDDADNDDDTNNTNKKKIKYMAKLYLRRHATNDRDGKNASKKKGATKCEKNNEDDDNDTLMELNVVVYTLQTITNPFQKYLLWLFTDVMPHLFLWMFQMLWYLIYFLLGGLLLSSKGRRTQIIQPFSGIKTTTATTTAANDNGKQQNQRMRCRITEPLLVWKAMAAHHSQFVWYRRLSVLFSRYTYINDLDELSPIDVPPFDDYDGDNDEDDKISSLPPVVTIQEDAISSSPPFLLTLPQMNALRKSVLPTGLHHRPWKRIYSLMRDGDSFVAFRKRMEDWNKQQGSISNTNTTTLLVVKTTKGDVIGGYADVPIVPLASNIVGSGGRSCLFKILRKQQEDCEEEEDPVVGVEVYGKDCFVSKKVLFSASRRIVAFGGGNGGGDNSDGNDGGSLDEGFGLCLSDGFARGTTARCVAFRNKPLVDDGVFDVLDVEVWGFVFGQF